MISGDGCNKNPPRRQGREGRIGEKSVVPPSLGWPRAQKKPIMSTMGMSHASLTLRMQPGGDIPRPDNGGVSGSAYWPAGVR